MPVLPARVLALLIGFSLWGGVGSCAEQGLVSEPTSESADSSVEPFSHAGWPGEGIPQFAFRGGDIRVYAEPDVKSASTALQAQAGTPVEYQASLQITLQPVVLQVIAPVTLEWCPSGPRQLQPGDTLEHLQYRAEGASLVRVDGELCEVVLFDYADTLRDINAQPLVEWWIKLTEGWLLVNRGSLVFLDRQF